jgi:hypothetical protein
LLALRFLFWRIHTKALAMPHDAMRGIATVTPSDGLIDHWLNAKLTKKPSVENPTMARRFSNFHFALFPPLTAMRLELIDNAEGQLLISSSALSTTHPKK